MQVASNEGRRLAMPISFTRPHPYPRPAMRFAILFKRTSWRWIGLIGAILSAILLILAAGGRLLPRDRTWERIQAEKRIRIGMDPSFPPFEFLDANGQLIGFDVDLALALAEEMDGLRVDFISIGFDGLYDSLLAGRFDAIISALPVDRAWTKDVRYSQPYFEAGLVLVISSDRRGQISRPEDLVGQRVAVEWGAEGDVYGRSLARRIGRLELLPRQTPAEALMAVQNGEAAAAFVDAISAYQFIDEQSDLVVVGAPLTEVSYAIATRQSSPLLGRAIDEALLRLRTRGVIEELSKKWL